MQYVARQSYPEAGPLETTSRLPVLFARGAQAPPPPAQPTLDFERIRLSGEFVALRNRIRRFVFPMSLLFFTWYMTYVLLAAYAHEFMSRKVFGQVTMAIALGLLQFLTTAVITGLYVRFANRRVDPQAALVRRQGGEP